MKISNNMSERSFRLYLQSMRVLAVVFLFFSLVFPQHLFNLAAFSAISVVGSILFSRARLSFRLEVYDLGQYLRLKLDNEEQLLNFWELKSIEIRSYQESLDLVMILLDSNSKFGKLIKFYPDMTFIPMGRLDLWVKHFNERINAARLEKLGSPISLQ